MIQSYEYRKVLACCVSLTWLAFGSVLGCAGEDGEDSAHDDGNAVQTQQQDTQVPQCPDGQIPWQVAVKSIGAGEGTYLEKLADDDVPVEHPWAIELQRATCGGTVISGNDADGDGINDGDWSQDWLDLRRECAGDKACTFSPNVCAQSFSIEYTCSTSDRDESDVQRVYTASGMSGIGLACAQPARQKVEVASETAYKCIYEDCHGRTYRDPVTLECVADATKDEVGLINFGWEQYNDLQILEKGSIRPLQDVQTQANQKYLDTFTSIPTRIYSGALYEFPVYLSIDARLPKPVRSTMSVWIADTFTIYQANGLQRTSKPYYRCLAFDQDIKASDFMLDSRTEVGQNVYMTKVQRVFSEECVKGEASIAAALKDLSEGERLAYKASSFMMTYDIAGRTALHENLTLSASDEANKQQIDTNPLCTPDPVDFYYDASKKMYDMAGYYKQRPSMPYERTFQFEKTGAYKLKEIARLAEIAPLSIKSRKDEIVLSAQSPVPQALPVEVTWSSRNFYREHLFQPFHDIGAEGFSKGFETGKPEDGLEIPRLRAEIYLMKSNSGVRGNWTDALYLGDIPLSGDGVTEEGNAPQGKTDSRNVLIPRSVVRAFMNSSGANYIGPEDGPQRYDIGYCINSDVKLGAQGWDGFSDHPEAYTSVLDQRSPDWKYVRFIGGSRPRIWNNYVMEENALTDAVRLNTTQRTYGYLRQNCTWQPTPVLIDVDYFETPQLPISPDAFGGSQSDTGSGDNTMSSNNNNDSEVTCDDAAKVDCDDVFVSGTRSDGADRRSYFNITSESDRTEGSEVSGGARGEMLSFQVLDPDDPSEGTLEKPNEDSANWPGKDERVSTPVTITIEPDWDGLKAKLQYAASGTNIEWETGRYAGTMGLGVGWGIKNIWNIGPVPVMVIFTITVGASVGVEISFQFAPTKDQEYPCLNSSGPCLQLVEEAMSFEDAMEYCNVKGGRLAEASTEAEATALADTLPEDESVWIGAQLGYLHPDQQCKTNYDATLCANNRTQYRWVTSNLAFEATRQGDIDADIYTLDTTALETRYPYDAAIYYDPGVSKLKTDSVEVPRQFVCYYDAAAKETFLEWGLKIGFGIAAGFGLQGCVPSDNPGFCLGASLNVVALSIGPTLTNTYHWLFKQSSDSSPFRRNGNTKFEVPFTITLFEGAFEAVVSFLISSVKWTIASFDGIKLFEQTLYEFNLPVSEDL